VSLRGDTRRSRSASRQRSIGLTIDRRRARPVRGHAVALTDQEFDLLACWWPAATVRSRELLIEGAGGTIRVTAATVDAVIDSIR
jgi:DNA-binding response OmpR family regulator